MRATHFPERFRLWTSFLKTYHASQIPLPILNMVRESEEKRNYTVCSLWARGSPRVIPFNPLSKCMTSELPYRFHRWRNSFREIKSFSWSYTPLKSWDLKSWTVGEKENWKHPTLSQLDEIISPNYSRVLWSHFLVFLYYLPWRKVCSQSAPTCCIKPGSRQKQSHFCVC